MSSDCSAPQIFEQDYYQRLHDIEEQHWWAQGMRDAMEALLRRPLGAATALRVLDVGCGTGYLLHHMQERYSLKESPVGIDVSDMALKFCQERGIRSLAVARADQLPFASSTYDLVVCVDTIQHLSPGEVEMTLREVARTLRPGGLLYLRTNSALCHTRYEGDGSCQVSSLSPPDGDRSIAAVRVRGFESHLSQRTPRCLGHAEGISRLEPQFRFPAGARALDSALPGPAALAEWTAARSPALRSLAPGQGSPGFPLRAFFRLCRPTKAPSGLRSEDGTLRANSGPGRLVVTSIVRHSSPDQPGGFVRVIDLADDACS